MELNTIFQGDCAEILKTFPAQSVDCCVTSPPYFQLRKYGDVDGQIGIEGTPDAYIENLIAVFKEVNRVLKDTGTLWVVIGDSYAGSGKGCQGKQVYLYRYEAIPKGIFSNEDFPAKSLIGIPWRFALAMQKDWLLRQDIIWAKSNPMPEPCKDRFCRSHEYIFLFAKQQKYYFNHEYALEKSIIYNKQKNNLIKRGYMSKPDENGLRPERHRVSIETEPYKTMRSVWFVETTASKEKHYAMFPQQLITPCILCGCPENGIVLDPFIGSGTTAIVAKKLMRKYIGCDINQEYVKIAERRLAETNPLFDICAV